MLTTLTLENREESIFRKKPLCFLPSNSLKLSENTAGDLKVKSFSYIDRCGKISFERIAGRLGGGPVLVDRAFGNSADKLKNAGIKIFSAEKFRGRLCANMAIACLEATGKKPLSIKIGIFDPLGEAVDLPRHFLGFTSEVYTVTKSIELYKGRAQEIMWERGAPLSVSKRIEILSRCDLIVAPHPIDVLISPRREAVVLTCRKPLKNLGCRVYYSYDFKLSTQFSRLRPEGIDTELFAAGLYEICKFYSLGNTVPLLCKGDFDAQTYLSLGRYLRGISPT